MNNSIIIHNNIKTFDTKTEGNTTSGKQGKKKLSTLHIKGQIKGMLAKEQKRTKPQWQVDISGRFEFLIPNTAQQTSNTSLTHLIVVSRTSKRKMRRLVLTASKQSG